MDYQIWSIIGNVLSLLIGGGGVSLLYFRQEKKTKELQNEITAISEWKDLYSELKADNKEKDDRVEELWKEVERHRDEKVELRDEILKNTQKIGDLQNEITELKIKKCEVRKCPKRVPPSDF